MSNLPKLLAVVGVTATGKTRLSIGLAKYFGGEIINADPQLLYQGMSIGVDKPTPQTMEGIPHHLISVIPLSEHSSLLRYNDLTRKVILAVVAAGKLPIVIGGSGQYVWSLLEAWDIPRVPPNIPLQKRLYQRVEEEGIEALYRELLERDPQQACQVQRGNVRRVIRALERVAAGYSGATKASRALLYDSLVIGVSVEQEELEQRIAARIQRMVALGWEQEVKALIDRGIEDTHYAMRAIGYREMAAKIRGEITTEEFEQHTLAATKKLMRAQRKWFRPSDTRIHWIDGKDPGAGLKQGIIVVEQWLERYKI